MATGSKAFDMGKMAIGGIGQVLDSVEFVKRAWSSMNIPSPLVPTMDVEELDKRIADLKAVEQWLNVNLSMLHGTIQGLEIQRGTIAAVKAFGATIGNFSAAQAESAAPARSRPVVPEPPPPPVFTPPPAAFTPPPPSFAAAAAPEAASEPAAGKDDDAPSDKAALPPAMLPGINPTAWWNLLQQNFNQVAQAALSGSSLPAAAAGAAMAAAKGASDGAKAAAARAKASGPAPARKRAAAQAPAKAPAKAPAQRKRATAAKPRPPRSPA